MPKDFFPKRKEDLFEECIRKENGYMKNFEDVISLFLEEEACIQIENSDELYDSCKKLIFDEELRQNMVDNAYKVVENNRGSMEKQYNYLKEYLN